MDVERLDEREAVEAVPAAHPPRPAVGGRTSVRQLPVEPGAVVPPRGHHHEQAGCVVQAELAVLPGDEDASEVAVVASGEEVHGVGIRGAAVVPVDVFSTPRTDPDRAS